MTAAVMFAVLAAAVLHAGWNTLVKAGADKLLSIALVVAGAGAVALPFALARPLPAAASLPYIAISAVIHIAYFSLIGIAYRGMDLSVAYPLTRGTAPLLTTFAVLLVAGEAPAPLALAGIALVCGGILWLAHDAGRRSALPAGAFAAAVLNAFIVAFYTVVDGLGGRLSLDPFGYNVWVCVMDAAFFLPFALFLRGPALARELAKGWRIGLAGGAASFAAYGIAIWAMTRAPIGLVAALRESSVLFAAAFAAFYLGEKFGRARTAAACLLACGLAAMKLA